MSTIKISELATSNISLSDFFVKADSSGVANKNTIQELSNLLQTVDDTAFKGSIAIADVPTENGWFFASQSGTYTNCGGLVIDTTDNIAIIIVSGTFDTFNKIDIPVNIAIDAAPTDGSNNAVSSGGVFDAIENAEAVVNNGTFSPTDNVLAATQKSTADYIDSQIDSSAFPLSIIWQDGKILKTNSISDNANYATTEKTYIGDLSKVYISNSITTVAAISSYTFWNGIESYLSTVYPPPLTNETIEITVPTDAEYITVCTDIDKKTDSGIYGIKEEIKARPDCLEIDDLVSRIEGQYYDVNGNIVLNSSAIMTELIEVDANFNFYLSFYAVTSSLQTYVKFYDADKLELGSLVKTDNTTPLTLVNEALDLPIGTKYIQLSQVKKTSPYELCVEKSGYSAQVSLLSGYFNTLLQPIVTNLEKDKKVTTSSIGDGVGYSAIKVFVGDLTKVWLSNSLTYVAGISSYSLFNKANGYVSTVYPSLDIVNEFLAIEITSEIGYIAFTTDTDKSDVTNLYATKDELARRKDTVSILGLGDITSDYYFDINGNKVTGGTRKTLLPFKVNEDLNYYLSIYALTSTTYTYLVYLDEFQNVLGSEVKTDNTIELYKWQEKIILPTGTVYIEAGVTNPNYLLDLFVIEKDLSEVIKLSKDFAGDQLQVPAVFDCAVGLQMNLNTDYFSATKGLDVLVSDSISGFESRNGYIQYTPTTASTNKTLRWLVYQNNGFLNPNETPLSNKVTSFREIDRTFVGTGNKAICIHGDSLINNISFVDEIFNSLNTDGGYTIESVGTRTTAVGGYNNEGHGGRDWDWFVNDEASPFVFSGVVDFAQYTTLTGASTIDVLYSSLGTNDVIGAEEDFNFNEVMADAKTFIDAFFTTYPNSKMILGLPPLGAEPQPLVSSSWSKKERRLRVLNNRYIKAFDNGVYHANLTTVAHGAWVNRVHGYPTESTPISSRMPLINEVKFTDTIHPTDEGYLQLSDAVYSKIRAILNGL